MITPKLGYLGQPHTKYQADRIVMPRGNPIAHGRTGNYWILLRVAFPLPDPFNDVTKFVFLKTTCRR